MRSLSGCGSPNFLPLGVQLELAICDLFLFFEKAFFDSLFSNRIALDLSPFYFMRGESSGNIVIVTIILITMLGVTLFITWFRGWRDDVY